MNQSIVIRNYRPDDVSAVVEFCRELLRLEITFFDRMLHPDAIGPWYVEKLLADCETLDGNLLVAENEGELLGYATIFTNVQSDNVDEESYTHAYLGHLLVAEYARGRGIGRLLITECEARARDTGCKWMRISVLADNTDAHSLYNSLGYADHLTTVEKLL